jgi:hypothetical protein
MAEYGVLFVLWILILYLLPFVYILVLERVDMSLIGTVALTVPTTILFPLLIYFISGNILPIGSQFMVPSVFILILLWNFFTESFDIRNNFFLSIINLYPPAAAAMLILLLLGIINFSLILIPLFIVPAAAYYFLRHLGYVTSCTFIVSYLLFDLYGALIISALLSAGIILYKARFRRVEDAGEMSIGETITSGMPVFAYTGFSEVKNYDEIPDEAIDPYTQHRIHELITQGKKIVKCNACETYYDKEILNFYRNSCAVFGCANSKF